MSWNSRIQQAYSKDAAFSDPAFTSTLVQNHGFYCKDGKVVMPDADNLRHELMLEKHNSPYSGHVGFHKTYKSISRFYWWQSMREDMLKHVTQCHTCQLNKSRTDKPSGLLQPLEIPENSWDVVSMDFITGLPQSTFGHNTILVMVDKRTKMVHIVPCYSTCDALQTAKLFVRNVVRLHGVPEKSISDRRPQFTSKFSEAVLRIIGTQQALSTAYHPQTDGQTERMNAVLEDMLRHYVSSDQTDWDEHLDMAEFAINSAHQESTGHSPFELNYGLFLACLHP